MPDTIAPGGLQTDRFEETRAKFVQLWRDNFGPNANTASDTPDGHIIDWGTAMAQAVIERQATTYQAQFLPTVPDVNGASQILGPLFGTFAKPATRSTGQILAFGVTGTSIGAGSVCSTSQGASRFQTDQTLEIEQSIWVVFVFGPALESTAVTITLGGVTYGPSFGVEGTGPEVAQTASFLLPAIDDQIALKQEVYEDSSGQGILIVETKGIISATVSVPNADSDVFRGSLMPVTSEDEGPIEAQPLTLTRVDTPAPGDAWKGCANLNEIIPGSEADTLAQYVQRHIDTLGKNGTSSLVGLIGRLRDVNANPGIEYVQIYNNPAGIPDAEGRPPHSFEVVYRGGTPEVMALQVWENHPLGIQTVGTQSFTIADPRTLKEHAVFLTSVTDLFAWVSVEITPGEGFPTTDISDLQVLIANNIVAFGNSLGVGGDSYLKDVEASMGVSGVLSCVVKQGFGPAIESFPIPTLFAFNIITIDIVILLWNTTRITVTINE